VTSIGDYAFRNCYRLTQINIPEGVTSIGYNTFDSCSKLQYVTLPQSLKNIGENAFFQCCSLTEVNIPAGVTNIGDGAFRRCTGKLTITCDIPPAYYIGIYYDYFSSLHDSEFSKITIGEGVTLIKNYAFSRCSSITEISIPTTMAKIEDGAFNCCTRLKAIQIKDLAAWCSINFCGHNSNPLEYAHNLYLNGELVTNLIVPDMVNTIKHFAFHLCESLHSILIPKSVKNIEKGAFRYCGIVYLTILGKPTIEEVAFEGCSRLADVYCYSEEVPPAEEAFGKLDLSQLTLHVPNYAMEQYKNTEPWCRFGTIVAIK
jgi:hypothetical protein